MPKRTKRNSSLVGWTLAVTVPLVVLALVAALGMRAQKTAAFLRMQEEAAAVSASQAELLSEQLLAAIEELPRVSSAPLPGSPSSLDDILDGTSIMDLVKLRENPDAGYSPSGLPRRALAALRLEYLYPGSQKPDELARLLTVEAPSVLTLPALKRLQDQHEDFEIPEVWHLIDQLEELKAANPDGGWIMFRDEYWWISAGGDRYLPPSALTFEGFAVSDFANIRLSSNREALTEPRDGEILASTPVDFPSPLALDWILTDPDAIDASVRQQTRWMVTLLAASLIISAIGLFAILRMVREERRLGKLKSQFVASVSHELRAPIGSIRLMADALEADRVDQPKEFHRLISRESERLSHLIENVLDFARIEEGERHYDFQEGNLTELVRDVTDLFSARAADTGHEIKLSLAEGVATVDRAAFQQAAANLLDNALKFSPPESTVSVSLICDDSSWTLAVSDEGPGVPESERERIFERFHRLGDELRRETKGTGIGLSLVQHIAQAHGGSISVANNPTTFTLSAPLHPPVAS